MRGPCLDLAPSRMISWKQRRDNPPSSRAPLWLSALAPPRTGYAAAVVSTVVHGLHTVHARLQALPDVGAAHLDRGLHHRPVPCAAEASPRVHQTHALSRRDASAALPPAAPCWPLRRAASRPRRRFREMPTECRGSVKCPVAAPSGRNLPHQPACMWPMCAAAATDSCHSPASFVAA